MPKWIRETLIIVMLPVTLGALFVELVVGDPIQPVTTRDHAVQTDSVKAVQGERYILVAIPASVATEKSPLLHQLNALNFGGPLTEDKAYVVYYDHEHLYIRPTSRP